MRISVFLICYFYVIFDVNRQVSTGDYGSGIIGEDDVYLYVQRYHPLGVGLRAMNNFGYLHELLHPEQTKHIGDPNNSIQPNAINVQTLFHKVVNLRTLTLDVSTLNLKRKKKTTSKSIPISSIP